MVQSPCSLRRVCVGLALVTRKKRSSAQSGGKVAPCGASATHYRLHFVFLQTTPEEKKVRYRSCRACGLQISDIVLVPIQPANDNFRVKSDFIRGFVGRSRPNGGGPERTPS